MIFPSSAENYVDKAYRLAEQLRQNTREMKENTEKRLKTTLFLTPKKKNIVENKPNPKRQKWIARKNSRARKHRSILEIV